MLVLGLLGILVAPGVLGWPASDAPTNILHLDYPTQCARIRIGEWRAYAEISPSERQWLVGPSRVPLFRGDAAEAGVAAIAQVGNLLVPVQPDELERHSECEVVVPFARTASLWRHYRFASGGLSRLVLTNDETHIPWPIGGSERSHAGQWTLRGGAGIAVDVAWNARLTRVSRDLCDRYGGARGLALPVTHPFAATVRFAPDDFRCGAPGNATERGLAIGQRSIHRFQWLLDRDAAHIHVHLVIDAPERGGVVPWIPNLLVLFNTVGASVWGMYKTGCRDAWRGEVSPNTPYGAHLRGHLALWHRLGLAYVLGCAALFLCNSAITLYVVTQLGWGARQCHSGGVCTRTEDLAAYLACIWLVLGAALGSSLWRLSWWRRSGARPGTPFTEFSYLAVELAAFLCTVVCAYPWDNRLFLYVTWVAVTIAGAAATGSEVIRLAASFSRDPSAPFERLALCAVFVPVLVFCGTFVGTPSLQRMTPNMLSAPVAFWVFFVCGLLVPVGVIYATQTWLQVAIERNKAVRGN